MTDFERYIISRWAYSVGQPIITDAEYTVLDRAMKHAFSEDEYCTRSWSSDPCPVELLQKYGYGELIKAVVLSDKTESIPSLNSLYEIQQVYASMSTPHSLSFKLDGWNIQASYYNGDLINVQSRGRSMDAINANVLFDKFPKSIPMDGKVLITTECTIPDREFQWFKDNYGSKSQRGAVSTAIANPGKCLDHIAVHAHGIRCSEVVTDTFGMLKSLGLEVPMYTYVDSYESLIEAIEAYSNYKDSYGYPTDGLVVAGDATRALRVHAWEEPIHMSYVVGFEESYGPHSISVKCRIRPITLRNSTQSVLPVTNLRRVINMNLRIGYPVAFRTVSAAIADVDEETTRLLQKEWAGREAAYRHMIDMQELTKGQ